MPNYFVLRGEEESQFVVETIREGVYAVTTPDGRTLEIDAYEPETGRLNLVFGGRSYDFDVRENDDAHFMVQRRGIRETVEVLNDRQRRMRAAGVGGSSDAGPELKSPMAGKVVAIETSVGTEVEEGTAIIIVEAMKMENDLKAHRSGAVTDIKVSVGDAVEVGDVLIVIGE